MGDGETERRPALETVERLTSLEVRIENLEKRLASLESINARLLWLFITPVLTAILSIVIIK